MNTLKCRWKNLHYITNDKDFSRAYNLKVIYAHTITLRLDVSMVRRHTMVYKLYNTVKTCVTKVKTLLPV